MDKEQDSIAYSVFFKNFKEYVLLRISAKYVNIFYGHRTFDKDICISVSLLGLSGCISYLNNHFIISNNSKTKKVYLVE